MDTNYTQKLVLFCFACLVACQSKQHQDSLTILGSHELDTYGIAQNKEHTYTLYIRPSQYDTNAPIDRHPYQLRAPILKSAAIDINGNGQKELVLMVKKRTRYDTVVRNRLFIFKTYKNCVRPLWLGSRLGGNLLNYKLFTKQKKTYIRALEKRNHRYFVAEYTWNKFGFRFVKYTIKDTTNTVALQYF